MVKSEEAIGEVTATFFAAFTNAYGPAPIDTLYDVCLPETVVVNATKEPPQVYGLRSFVESRRSLLSSGTLTAFREFEVSGDTVVLERIAYRTGAYEKTWTERGQRMHGGGKKIISFVLTAQGWKIASVLWYDPDSGTIVDG